MPLKYTSSSKSMTDGDERMTGLNETEKISTDSLA
jgi:hypothetical protein